MSISKKAQMLFNFSANLPAVEADANQLRQVIMNLIINASEALGEKSGAITNFYWCGELRLQLPA